MAPNQDEKLYDQLVAHLAGSGRIREDFGAGVVTISALHGRALDPPMRLHVTPASLNAHLETTAGDAARAHPDVVPLEAAWRVYTERVATAVENAGPGETEIVVDGTDVVTRAAT